MALARRALRIAFSFGGIALITWIAYDVFPVNSTTSGFAYLLFILIVASTWGFLEAATSSVLATLALNFFFFEPKLTLTIADPQNWVALFAFLVTSLIASQLSTRARRRTLDAMERQKFLEQLYAFGRGILLIGGDEPFARQLARRLAETFELSAVALYESRTGQIYRAGPLEFDGMDSQLREAALQGTSFSDPQRNRAIFAVRLGSSPIASLALQGLQMPDSVLQSIGNLVAIGLERANAQELGHEIEVTRRSEELRTSLLDAMAHEFKTPLTSIRAATTALLGNENLNREAATRMLKIADEEAAHLEELIDNALDSAQVESQHIQIDLQRANLNDTVSEVVRSMRNEIGDRRVIYEPERQLPLVPMDRRLIRLAVKQLLDNALKYSPANAPVTLQTLQLDGTVVLEVKDHGKGIPEQEQRRIFERFYRSPSVQDQIPGSGLGLSIAHRILEAHKGDLTVRSRPGETMFRLMLPVEGREEH